MDYDVLRDVQEMASQLCNRLFEIALPLADQQQSEASLIFPTTRDGLVRVSEQEPRHLFCDLLSTGRKYWYALEAPTVQTYKQSGSKELSARTDLAMYVKSQGLYERVANIEFKAKSPKQIHFSKDMEKLVREGCASAWFHLLENEDKRTVPAVLEKIKKAISEQVDRGWWPEQRPTFELLVMVCVLRTRRAIVRKVVLNERPSLNHLSDIFDRSDDWEDLN
jgi:hypothetical protein